MFNLMEELFAPGRKHTEDERQRLALTREDLGEGAPHKGPIDLASGKVVVRIPGATPAPDTAADTAPAPDTAADTAPDTAPDTAADTAPDTAPDTAADTAPEAGTPGATDGP
ncbi:DUF6191 domain-containing protein [Streptomyces sp. NPDC051921]|uniref:DUF6191 domain-containing protein n=1 Tax=Streptomyces sp. NPDC051921 TaxID=3155806 RepID=UPI00341EF856